MNTNATSLPSTSLAAIHDKLEDIGDTAAGIDELSRLMGNEKENVNIGHLLHAACLTLKLQVSASLQIIEERRHPV
jgi:hypothetical protein